MKTLRQTNIKNSQNYFLNSMTNNKNFDPTLLRKYHLKALLF